MKIIGVGFGRTGTLSIYTALNSLGYSCYHMFEVLENKANSDHLDFWLKVSEEPPGTQHDWHRVFERYDATVDNPACCVWTELIAKYPDAKVLLSLHPKGAEGWYRSAMNTIYKTESDWQFKLLSVFIPKTRKMTSMCRELVWNRALRGTMKYKEKAIARYNEHVEEVKAAVPADRLLVYCVDQGWEPLCSFLGRQIPDTDFPKVNDTEAFLKFLSTRSRVAYVVLALGALLAAGLGYFIKTTLL